MIYGNSRSFMFPFAAISWFFERDCYFFCLFKHGAIEIDFHRHVGARFLRLFIRFVELVPITKLFFQGPGSDNQVFLPLALKRGIVLQFWFTVRHQPTVYRCQSGKILCRKVGTAVLAAEKHFVEDSESPPSPA